MSEEPEISLEEFMGLPEAPTVSTGSTDHKEATVAKHLLDFAESVGYKPFPIAAWLNKAVEDSAFNEVISRGVVTDVEKAKARYQAMELVDTYQKTNKETGVAAPKWYIKSPVLTALRNITRADKVYFQRRGDNVYIIKVADFKKGTSNKAKKFFQSLEFNRKFMYETKDRASLF